MFWTTTLESVIQEAGVEHSATVCTWDSLHSNCSFRGHSLRTLDDSCWTILTIAYLCVITFVYRSIPENSIFRRHCRHTGFLCLSFWALLYSPPSYNAFHRVTGVLKKHQFISREESDWFRCDWSSKSSYIRLLVPVRWCWTWALMNTIRMFWHCLHETFM